MLKHVVERLHNCYIIVDFWRIVEYKMTTHDKNVENLKYVEMGEQIDDYLRSGAAVAALESLG